MRELLTTIKQFCSEPQQDSLILPTAEGSVPKTAHQTLMQSPRFLTCACLPAMNLFSPLLHGQFIRTVQRSQRNTYLCLVVFTMDTDDEMRTQHTTVSEAPWSAIWKLFEPCGERRKDGGGFTTCVVRYGNSCWSGIELIRLKSDWGNTSQSVQIVVAVLVQPVVLIRCGVSSETEVSSDSASDKIFHFY